MELANTNQHPNVSGEGGTSGIATGDTGILELQGAPSAIRNPRNARQCYNPPQSAIRPTEPTNSLQAFGAPCVLANDMPQSWSPKFTMGCIL
eukprot:1126021-Alexandrium_andersonii.AAC.1